MTHTPGPWTIGQSLTNDGGKPIMAEERIAVVDDYQTPEGEANARLIESAPDLLAELRRMFDDYADELGLDPHECVGGPFARARRLLDHLADIEPKASK